jgi:SAM-dependent methyltransferase
VLDAPPLHPSVDRRLSSSARAGIEASWAVVAPEVTGRVLDLAERTVGDLARLDAAGERFDVVLSVGRLAAEADPIPLLTLSRHLVGEDGHLVFVEPSKPGGRRGTGARLTGPALAAGAGWRTDRDVPPLLRQAGFVICTSRRRDLPATAWPVRLVIAGTALASATPGGAAAGSRPIDDEEKP